MQAAGVLGCAGLCRRAVHGAYVDESMHAKVVNLTRLAELRLGAKYRPGGGVMCPAARIARRGKLRHAEKTRTKLACRREIQRAMCRCSPRLSLLGFNVALHC